jgi:hypothetical protein
MRPRGCASTSIHGLRSAARYLQRQTASRCAKPRVLRCYLVALRRECLLILAARDAQSLRVVGDDNVRSTQARRFIGHDAKRRVTVAPRGVQVEVGAHSVAKRCAARKVRDTRPGQEAGANRIGLDTVIPRHDLRDDGCDVRANPVQGGERDPLLG